MAAADDNELPHGWTPPQIAALAQVAAHKRWAVVPDYEERCDIASLAIIECLYTSDPPPTRGQLLDAGEEAITAELHKHGAMHGVPYGQRTGAGFATYWHARAHVSRAEERLLDSIALYQVFAILSPIHQQVIAAVARHWGDRNSAARELGITRMALMVRLSRARAEFRWYWFWPETPPRHWGADSKWNLNGHQYADGRNRAMVAIRQRKRRST